MTVSRFAAWLLAALAFPPAGLVAHAIAGPAASLGPALLSGAIAGTVIGLAYGAVLHGRDLPRVAAWIVATAVGLALGLATAVTLVGIPEPGAEVLVMGVTAGAAVGTAQELVGGGTPMDRVRWTAVILGSWTVGWWVTATVGVDLTQGWPIFGLTGAIAAQLISGIVLLASDRITERTTGRRPGIGVTTELAAAALLIVVPVAFNVAFAILGAVFDYPGILRRSPDEILRRFHAGGSRLRLRWWVFMVTALGMLPLAALLGLLIAPHAPALAVVATATGIVASLVRAVGLARWPFLVPELARRYVAAGDGPDGAATRDALEVVFVAVHRLLGIGIGEHLGYLLTGAWTLLTAAGLMAGDGALVPVPLALVGIPIGIALLVGAFEFVGPHEPKGWWVADRIVPLTYIAWSLWLIVLGITITIGTLG